VIYIAFCFEKAKTGPGIAKAVAIGKKKTCRKKKEEGLF